MASIYNDLLTKKVYRNYVVMVNTGVGLIGTLGD